MNETLGTVLTVLLIIGAVFGGARVILAMRGQLTEAYRTRPNVAGGN